jgi:hypothetical protein
LTEYIVEAKSRKDIRDLANLIREIFHLEDKLYIPILELLEVFREVFDDFNYEIVEDSEFPNNVHADTDIRTGHVRIRESIYDSAYRGEGRDRMTIAHEIGHYLMLHYFGFRLERNYSHEEVPCYKDPEWQAKCFAGELLISEHLMKGYTVEDIVQKCGVSYSAAEVQYQRINNERGDDI